MLPYATAETLSTKCRIISEGRKKSTPEKKRGECRCGSARRRREVYGGESEEYEGYKRADEIAPGLKGAETKKRRRR